MISESTGLQLRLKEWTAQFISCLTENMKVAPDGIAWNIPPADMVNMPLWHSPENIDSGVSGVIIVLIELYRQSNNKKYLLLAEQAADGLVTYCKGHPSQNFSFYTGRSGVVYVLIQLYLVNHDKKLLAEALDIIRPANEEYLGSSYVTNYLFDGRAGTTLVIFYLYQVTGAPFLLEYLNLFTRKIIADALPAEEGICWKDNYGKNARQSCGFAFGTSGIAYVFLRLAGFFSMPAFGQVVKTTIKYRGSCWMEEMQNWSNCMIDIRDDKTFRDYRELYEKNDLGSLNEPKDDISWAYGTTGIGFFQVLFDKDICFGGPSTDMASITKKLANVVREGKPTEYGLFNGWSGTGMFFLHAFKASKDEYFLDNARHIADRINADLTSPIDLKGGLFHGNLGALYFLLKMKDEGDTHENVLSPFMKDIIVDESMNRNAFLSVTEVQKVFLLGFFSRTMGLWENLFPNRILEFYKEAAGDNLNMAPGKFIQFVEKLMIEVRGSPGYERLNDVFILEKERFTYMMTHGRPDIRAWFAELDRQDKVILQLNNPKNWLLDCTLHMSGKSKIITTKWNWTDLTSGEPASTENLHLPPREFHILLEMSAEYEVLETNLKTSGLVLHRFLNPKTVRQAFTEIKHYCRSCNEESLEEVAKGAGAKDVEDFISRMDFLVLHKIREFLFNGSLIILEAQNLIT